MDVGGVLRHFVSAHSDSVQSPVDLLLRSHLGLLRRASVNVVNEVVEHVPRRVLVERASLCFFSLRVHVLEVEVKIPTIPDSLST